MGLWSRYGPGRAGDSRKIGLRNRFNAAVQNPPMMMLYPPVSSGEEYRGQFDLSTMWRGVSGDASVYIHIPFCQTRCVFCPFHATIAREEHFEAYINSLMRELAQYSEPVKDLTFSSVYFGGGTPSVLPPKLVGRLIDGLRQHIDIGDADVTLETHPSTVDAGKLADFVSAGVNRLSFGIQSFDELVLRACGRGDTVDTVLPAVEAAMALPFRDVNLDLMYGLPEQSLESWENDLRVAAGLGVHGFTLYATVYLPGFKNYVEAQNSYIPTGDDRNTMYDMAYAYLNEAGYHQPHFGSGAFKKGGLNALRRNVARARPTLGLGTWAFSSTGAYVYQNQFPRAKWQEEVAQGRPPIRHVARVDDKEHARKFVVEALLLAYLDLDAFNETFGTQLDKAFPDEIAVLVEDGLAEIKGSELRLTRKGGRHLREIRYIFASETVVQAVESGRAKGL